ncbi:MAG TPA: AsmA family protein [Acidisoma sp.]|uniref:AsmA family protein n=1 Tax=Acidisoma sp. TaxID=1872115 RepID=UPI002CF8A8D7|nr:AsmA family protein [Acidisoma sp.]HTI01672.1 AsmA family protein [Acidisoma sp.]
MTRRRRIRLWLFLGTPILVVVLLILFWSWDWFIPLVEAQASAQLGRPVTIAHLHVHLGRKIRIVADKVVIQNPKDFPGDLPPLARIAHLGVTVDAMAYIRHRIISVPLIDVNGPELELRGLADGRNNYTLALKKSPALKPGQKPAPSPRLGDLTIEDGQLHAEIPKMKADFSAQIETAKAEGVIAQNGQTTELRAKAHGTYAGQPVTATLLTGALLSVTDTKKPFPIDMHIANGATHVALAGTVQDPMAFAGTDLDLTLQGADMADLYPLTGIPIPKTPAYKITGKLNYETATQRIHFDDFRGVVGNSDLEGTITEQPQGKKPDVTMDLASRRVDLADLGGFLGTNPGRATTKNATPEQRKKAATGAARAGHLLPTTPINLPKLDAANIHLHYLGHHIEGRNIPLDSLIVTMDLVDGAIDLHPLIFTVGKGRVQGDISIAPVSDHRVKLKADVHFDQVDVSRLMAATHAFKGAGAIGGRATIDGTGDSVATLMGDGNGGLAVYMAGGSLSALLIDLSGLEFGKALLSALGLPSQTNVDCMIGDFSLRQGMVKTQALLVDTGEALIGGTGVMNFKTEAINFEAETRSKNFSIGNLPAPIKVTGTLAKPAIGIGVKELAARGGLAAALGFLAAPLAILPTIELGVGDPHKCGELVAEVKSQVRQGKPGQKVPGTPIIKK